MNLQDYQREEQRISQALDTLRKKRGENPEKSMEERFLEQQLMELKTPVLADSRKMAEASKIQAAEEDREYNAPMNVPNRSAWQNLKPEVQQYARQIFPSLAEIEPSETPTPTEVKPQEIAAKQPEAAPEQLATEEIEPSEEGREPAGKEDSGRLDSFIPGLLDREGGFRAKVKGDQDTYKGITLQTYQQFKKDPTLTKDDLKKISDEDTRNITKRYYDEVGGDKIKDPRVSAILLDQNFNKGSRFLYQLQDYFGHEKSSKLEKETIDAINKQDFNQFGPLLLQMASQDYTNLAKVNPNKRRELEGWMNRLDKLRNEVGLIPTEYDLLKRPEGDRQPQFQPADIRALIQDMSDKEKQASLFKQMAKVRDAAASFGLGRQVATDYSMYDELAKRAQVPLRNLQLTRQLENEQAKNDPNSDISMFAKKSLEQFGIDTSKMANISYAQLQSMYPNLVQGLSAKIQSESKYATALMESLSKQQDKQDVAKEKKFNELNKRVEKVLQDKDLFKVYNDSQETLLQIEDALKNWNSANEAYKIKSQAAFVAYAKIAQKDASVLRESDIKVLAGGQEYSLPSLVAKFAAKTEGSSFSPLELQQFAGVVRGIKDMKKVKLQEKLNPILKTAKDAKVDLDSLIDPDLVKDIYSPTLKEKEARLIELREKNKQAKQK